VSIISSAIAKISTTGNCSNIFKKNVLSTPTFFTLYQRNADKEKKLPFPTNLNDSMVPLKKNPSPCFLRNNYIANNVFSAAEWILKDIEIKVYEEIDPGQEINTIFSFLLD
jgi:hypothetical protein